MGELSAIKGKCRGVVRFWNADKEYGFLEPDVFVHKNKLCAGAEIQKGMVVLYSSNVDERGRRFATDLEVVGHYDPHAWSISFAEIWVSVGRGAFGSLLAERMGLRSGISATVDGWRRSAMDCFNEASPSPCSAKGKLSMRE